MITLEHTINTYKRIGVCNYLWRLSNIFVAFIERQQLKGILFFRAYITREVRNNNLTLYLRCTTTTLITHLVHTGIIHAYVHLCDNPLDVSYVVFSYKTRLLFSTSRSFKFFTWSLIALSLL